MGLYFVSKSLKFDENWFEELHQISFIILGGFWLCACVDFCVGTWFIFGWTTFVAVLSQVAVLF
jgi:hypothetical protein